MAKGSFLFLGTGGSAGIPMIGCPCAVCTSSLPYNQRFRSSGLLRLGGKQILIDVGPEFRLQALNAQVNHLDAVLLTHAHADHIAGMDDLRAYYFLMDRKLPCFLSQETFAEISVRYHYMLTPLVAGKSVAAQLQFHVHPDEQGEILVDTIPVQYFSYFQAESKVTGYRIGDFAYVSDIRTYSEKILEVLSGVNTLVLSALCHVPTSSHFSVEEAIAFSKRVLAKRTYLTHIAHNLEHEETNALLPEWVRMSYDGLEISVSL